MFETIVAWTPVAVEPDYVVTDSGGLMGPGTANLLFLLAIYALPAIAVIAAVGALLSIAKSLRTLVHAHKLGPEPMGLKRDDITED